MLTSPDHTPADQTSADLTPADTERIRHRTPRPVRGTSVGQTTSRPGITDRLPRPYVWRDPARYGRV